MRGFDMKKKYFVPIVLVIFICFGLIFSACSIGVKFNFDENSTVNLTYTCVDDEKNFDIKLNAEQSHDLILSLNKVFYSEINDKDIDMAPSYDSLTIEINNETLVLGDVAYKIKYGGYFHFNGKVCKLEGKIDFMEAYMAENCPDVIPKSLPFDVRYVKSAIGEKENYQIITSVSQLENYIATEMQNIDLPYIESELFKDEVIAKYNDKYFENFFIVIFSKAASSGSYDFKVNNVYKSSDSLIINYEIGFPEGYGNNDYDVTCDMAYWYSFVELNNEYNTIKNVYLTSSK